MLGVLGAKRIPDWVKHKNSIYSIKLNLWCFLLIWCNLIEFNWFWCKKYKNICVLFVFRAKRGWQHRNMLYTLNYTNKKIHVTLIGVRCLIGVLLHPCWLWRHQLHTLLFPFVELEDLEISCLTDAELVISLSSIFLYSVISFGILLASGVG